MSSTSTYMTQYMRERRETYIALLGGVCVSCGTDQNLEFDHIDPKTKEHSISSLVGCSQQRMLAELKKCQLLCETCHIEKTTAQRAPFTHGSMYGWMKRKCTCAMCSAARRAWYDKRNADRTATRTERRDIYGGDARGPYSKDSPHGTNARYKRHCRCAECRAAATALNRKNNKVATE